MPRSRVALLLVVLVTAWLSPAVRAQTVWWVSAGSGGTGTQSNPFGTIQEGIDAAAVGGDEVRIAPGTYGERIDFLGKAVLVRRDPAQTGTVTIDGTGIPGSVVTFETGEGLDSVLEDVRITGGTGQVDPSNLQASGPCGGGVFLSLSSATLRRCEVWSNTAVTYGGGVYGYQSSAVLEDCDIAMNTTPGQGAGVYFQHEYDLPTPSTPEFLRCTVRQNDSMDRGGGMRFWRVVEALIEDCEVFENTAWSGGGGIAWYSRSTLAAVNTDVYENEALFGSSGGGLHYIEDQGSTFTDCEIYGNVASSSGNSGGGIYGDNDNGEPAPTFFNCLIRANESGAGAGAYLWRSSPSFESCTFTDNVSSGFGGALYLDDSSFPIVQDSILWNDTAAFGTAAEREVYLFGSAFPIATWSDVEDAATAPWFGTGCIDLDPMFTGAPGEVFLDQIGVSNPCVDAGSDTVAAIGLDAYSTRTDLALDVGQVDMGYHYLAGTPVTLALDGFVRGETTTLTVGGVQPGERVYVYASDAIGAGPCFPQLGGLCLDIAEDHLLGSAVATSAGTVAIPWEVSHYFPLVAISVQALVERGPGGADSVKTAVVTDTVQYGASFETFGAGGTTSVGTVPAIGSIGVPATGTSFQVTLTGGRPSGLAILYIGFSNTVHSGLPLPLDLTPFGAPGNTLYVSLDLSYTAVADASGNASRMLDVPFTPGLAGREFYAQWAVVDPAANPLGATVSDAATITIQFGESFRLFGDPGQTYGGFSYTPTIGYVPTDPVMGGAVTVTLTDGLAPGEDPLNPNGDVVLVEGLSNKTAVLGGSSYALPLDLGPMFGAPFQWLYVSIDTELPTTTDVNGDASYDVPLPDDLSKATPGDSRFYQWRVVNPSMNPQGNGWSDALEVVINAWLP